MEWIDQHMDDADFEEELVIVAQQEKPKSNLTLEERMEKAKELQARVRAKRMADDAKLARENEEARRIGDKELAAAKKLAEEKAWENGIAQRMKEKKELEAEKKRMMQQLERDKLERFGGVLPPEAQEKKKTPIELADHGIKTVTTLYTEMRAPGVAKTCLKTCATFIGNVLKDKTNEKFRRVNLDNEAVQKRVAKINGGLMILKAAGFEHATDGTNQLEIQNVDEKVLIAVLDRLKPYCD